jgi:inhibitor of cysteine peptidase
VELTEADAGVERAVAVGDDVVVRLEENRTTGFRWNLDLPDGVALVDDAFEAPSPGRPGQGGVHCFRLRAAGPGQYRLAAGLRRSWGDGDPQRTVEFPIRVS